LEADLVMTKAAHAPGNNPVVRFSRQMSSQTLGPQRDVAARSREQEFVSQLFRHRNCFAIRDRSAAFMGRWL
jgi:hypothetical protein